MKYSDNVMNLQFHTLDVPNSLDNSFLTNSMEYN